MSTIRIPTALRAYTQGEDELEVASTTVGTAVEELAARYPDLRAHLFNDQGRLRPYVNLFVNEQDIRTLSGADTPLTDGDRLMILPSIAGGSELEALDQRAMNISMAIRLGILLAAFIADAWWVVPLVGALMIWGTLRGHPDFQFLYRTLRRAGRVTPQLVLDNPEPHRFSLGVGGAFLAAATLAFIAGGPAVGWALTWVVIALTALNLFAGFCVGCAVYYWLNRLGAPGFVKSPPPDVFPGQRPRPT